MLNIALALITFPNSPCPITPSNIKFFRGNSHLESFCQKMFEWMMSECGVILIKIRNERTHFFCQILTESKSSHDAFMTKGDVFETQLCWWSRWEFFPFFPLQHPHFLCRDNPTLWLPDPDPLLDASVDVFPPSDSIMVSRVSIERTPVDCWSDLPLSIRVLVLVKRESRLWTPSELEPEYWTVLVKLCDKRRHN